MKWFWNRHKSEEVIARQNWEMAMDLKLANEVVQQKDKEIAMWKERGDRLSASHTHACEQLAELQKLFVKNQSLEAEFRGFKDAIEKMRVKP